MSHPPPPSGRRLIPGRRAHLPLAALLFCALAVHVAPAQDVRDVLVLHSYSSEFAWSRAVQLGIERAISEQSDEHGFAVSVHTEYLDAKRYPTGDLRPIFTTLFESKYGASPPDLIISVDDDALGFLFDHRNELFGRVPVVFSGLNVEDWDPKLLEGRANYTGVVERLDLASTVRLMLRLHADAPALAVVQDWRGATGRADRATLSSLQTELDLPVPFRFLADDEAPTQAALAEELRALDPAIPILFLGMVAEADGLSAEHALPALSEAARAPLYTHADAFFGHGTIGGKLLSGEIHGYSTGSLAVAALAGAPIDSLEVRVESSNAYRFDFRQLERFGISQRSLPTGSVVEYAPVIAVSVYRTRVALITIAAAVLLGLVIALIAMGAKRRSAEQMLVESETKYRTLVERQLDMVVQVDAEGRFLFVSPRYCEVFGKTEDELLGTQFLPLVHPDDRETTRVALESLSREPYACRLEQRAWTVNGWRWLAWQDAAVIDADGRISSIVGVGQDVTERKEAEEGLEQALSDKDSLMQEMNHRIKNNLAMITALIQLKADESGASHDLSDIQHQIDAIRIVHENLYRAPDATSIAMGPYLRELLETVFSTFAARPVKLELDADDTALRSRHATTFGLIVNELATNAIKHGLTGGDDDRFRCSLAHTDDTVELQVENSGRPFPEDVDLDNPSTLGLRIISLLVKQLSGTVSLQRSPHAVFTIRVPLPD